MKRRSRITRRPGAKVCFVAGDARSSWRGRRKQTAAEVVLPTQAGALSAATERRTRASATLLTAAMKTALSRGRQQLTCSGASAAVLCDVRPL